jgi:hypothetical protein
LISHRGLTAPSEFSTSDVGRRRRKPLAMRSKSRGMTIKTPIAALIVSIRR